MRMALLFCAPAFFTPVAMLADNIPLTDLGTMQLRDTQAKVTTYDGVRALKLTESPSKPGQLLAVLRDRTFKNGTIDAIGYKMQLPGSAVPGWPADVPLPIDPKWKSQYAASVRRLVRDGVDSPLANLFVAVAVTHLRMPRAPIEREARARHFYIDDSKLCPERTESFV